MLNKYFQCIDWISKIQKAAPKLGVDKDSMIHLSKFVAAMSRAKLGKVKKTSSLHDFYETKPKKKPSQQGGGPKKGDEALDQPKV